MKALFCIVSVVALTAACGPRDVATGRNSASQNGGGSSANQTKVIVLEDTGDRASTCPADYTDQKFVNLPADKDPGILSGDISGFLTVGNRNCYRIGSVVELQAGKDTPVRARLKVVRVEVIPAASVNSTHANALDMTVAALKTYANAEIQKIESLPQGSKGKFTTHNMVSITFFEVEGGTTASTVFAPTELTVYSKFGERAETCTADKADTNFANVAADKDDQIILGELSGFMAAGDRNCYRVGSLVVLQSGKDTPVRGMLKIVRVELVPVDKLTAAHAKILNMTLDELQTTAQGLVATAKFDARNFVHITVFEVAENVYEEPVF